jgi:hypothetical protein
VPRLKHADPGPAPMPNGLGLTHVALTPLTVSGLVVSKASLIEVLAGLVPGLVDIATTEDGNHFWLMLGPGGNDATTSQT